MRRRWGKRFHAASYARPSAGPIARSRRKLQAAFGSHRRYRFGIDEWYDPVIDREIDRLHAELKFDVVIVEYVFLSRALLRFGPETLKIIDTHDMFTDRHRRYLAQGQRPRWFSTSAAEEAKGLDRADVVIAIQDDERAAFSALTRRPVITLGHVVALKEAAAASDRSRMLFVASDNAINVDGLNWFLDQVMVLITARQPDANLVLAGSIGNAIDDRPGVTKLGRVDDLAPVYADSAVVVNPVQFNTGLSIKNLEALGFARPLVTSPVGTEGIEDGAGTAYRVGATAEQFANQVLELVQDAAAAAQLAESARAYAASRNRDTVAQLQAVLGGADDRLHAGRRVSFDGSRNQDDHQAIWR
jgi:glycosyltransferase involved in cell wall biosynthesis